MAKLDFYVLMLAVIVILSTFSFARGTSVSCNFDFDDCGWTSANTGKFQWKRGSGLTEDRSSGPVNDHTCANYNGNYQFISGGDSESRKDSAVLESQIFTLNNATTLSFWYTMNGFGTGTLSLSVIATNISSEVWKKAGRQGKDWIRDSVILQPGTIQLQFKSTVRIPVGSDVAIDDIQLLSESQYKDTNKSHCQTTTSTTTTTTTTTTVPTTTTAEPMNKTHKSSLLLTLSPSSSFSCFKIAGKTKVMPGTCDFEKDTCDNKITANDSNKAVIWERTNVMDGAKDRNNTIFGDHTFEKDPKRGFYLAFRNSWSIFNSKLIASIETPAIYANYACLSFWYNIPSIYSNLKVSIREYTGKLTPLWSVDNFIPNMKASNMTGWHEIHLSIFQDPPFTVVFQAYNNMHGAKVGIDDIEIIGANVTTGRTKPASEKTTQINHTPDITTRSTVGITGSVTSEMHTSTPSEHSVMPGNSTRMVTKTQASSKSDSTTPLISGSTTPIAATTKPIPSPTVNGDKKTTVHSTKTPSTSTSCLNLAETTETTCDFETDICGYKITANDTNRRVTWQRTNKMVGNIYQNDRIVGDHTFARNTTKGFYLVFSYGWSFSNPKLIASIETPVIHATYACLSFWYSIPSKYSNLEVLVRDISGNLTSIWSVDNFIPSKGASNMTGWHEKSLSIFEDQPFTVVFQAYDNNHLAKVGIDDIKITSANVTNSTPGQTFVNYSTKQQEITNTKPASPELQTSTQSIPSITTGKEHKKTIMPTTKKPTKIVFETGDNEKQTEEDKYERTSTIVGSAVGAVLALVLLIVVVYFIVHYKNKEKRRRRSGANKTETHQHLNGGVTNAGYTSGTYFDAPVRNGKTKVNGHAGHVYDNFTAYSLTSVNTISPENKTVSVHEQANGHANGHASPLSEADSDTSVRL